MRLTQLQHMADLLTSDKNSLSHQAAIDGLSDRMRGVEAVHAAGKPDDVLRQEHECLKAKLAQIQQFVEKHEDRENRMANYLEALDAARPMEGHTVVEAFKNVVQEVTEVKRSMRVLSDYVKDHIASNSGVGAGPGGMTATEV